MKRGDRFPLVVDNFEWINQKYKERNKEVLVLFWSISCEQCHEVLLKFIRDETVQCDKLAVHMPRYYEDTKINPIRIFLARHKIRIPVLLDHHVQLSNACNITYVPTILLLDEQFQLKAKKSGERSFESIKKYLSS